MAKTSEKAASNKQPESQRGKSRFAVQPRSTRTVLPDRPPREIDNEIVSILLGGDPTSLAVLTPNEFPSPVPAAPPSSLNPATPPVQEPQEEPLPEVSQLSVGSNEVEAPTLLVQETSRLDVTSSRSKVSSASEASTESSPRELKRISPAQPSRLKSQATTLSFEGIEGSVASSAEQINALEPAISTFDEFVERWKHGLRKGQLKVCEVLYQKTYARGATECVTSFSELGRLSGLKMRQCFNIIAQLEALKFVERAKSEATSNKKDQGSIIRFHLFPKS